MTDPEGIVTSLSEDGQAKVLIQSDDLCIPCASDVEVCHCSGGHSRLMIQAINTIGASVGDLVTISHRPGTLMKTLSIFLIIPFIGLISGLIVGLILNQRLNLDTSGVVIIAAAGLLGGITISIVRYRQVSEDIQPYISRIISTGVQAPPFLKVMDPVCKMEVDPTRAAGRIAYNGKNYYFCNVACLEAFTKDPARYLEGPI